MFISSIAPFADWIAQYHIHDAADCSTPFHAEKPETVQTLDMTLYTGPYIIRRL